MVSERYPHVSGDFFHDYYFTGNNTDNNMTLFNPGRRSSALGTYEKTSLVAHDPGMQRRCSMQADRSPYMPTPGADINLITSQQRFNCIQKPPLRNVVSAPVDNLESSRLLPRPPVIQRSDMIMQSVSLESVDSAAGDTARYKTELCRPFEETGHCRYGGKCQFAHGMAEMRSQHRHPKYKTERCRTFHNTGFCTYGQRCNFIHNDEERRGPAQSPTSPVISNRPRPSLPMVQPINTSLMSGSDSPHSSVTSGSPPSQSPSYLHEEMFSRHSPAPSFGSDGASMASTSYTPPPSPKHELTDYQFTSPLDFGLSLTQLRLSA